MKATKVIKAKATPAKKGPVKNGAVKKVPGKNGVVKKAPVKNGVVKKAPVKKVKKVKKQQLQKPLEEEVVPLPATRKSDDPIPKKVIHLRSVALFSPKL